MKPCSTRQLQRNRPTKGTPFFAEHVWAPHTNVVFCRARFSLPRCCLGQEFDSWLWLHPALRALFAARQPEKPPKISGSASQPRAGIRRFPCLGVLKSRCLTISLPTRPNTFLLAGACLVQRRTFPITWLDLFTKMVYNLGSQWRSNL